MNRTLALGSIALLALLPTSLDARWDGHADPDEEVIASTAFDMDGDGSLEALEILLTNGRRYVDEMLWCGMGDKWEGQFAVRVRRNEHVLSITSLNALMGHERLFFHAPAFRVVLQDLNGDGSIDFNLGQYAGCNGSYYFLFSIAPSGEVHRLSRHGYYMADHRNSTPVIRFHGPLVGFTFYSQSSGLFETAWYTWTGEDFERVRTTPRRGPFHVPQLSRQEASPRALLMRPGAPLLTP